MTDTKFIEARTVLIADLSSNLEQSIRAAILYYKEVYGSPKRVWVNQKDLPDQISEIEGYKIERRGGCPRGKVMVM